ncbi:hypothetical protein N7509_002697 [Penicillium cosmopolitanum]|uniref:Xylanolytic transcriptional activator regulatory domain-containing protein n=1 Tax=Penicillium cosmopolitanum TaxID=1131564 RepID=A0A9W9W9K9_9EURO|nr:uncharacterized protein N7509_002697 [Penicillium cosmopolitanum]KAJ5408814.1 hypothetical protein N7509_002697 [Penicillium cosmopolitanum]
MAYSIGINGSPSHMITEVMDSQSALRTWWTLYSLESDICLEYGKPLCIRETDAKAPYPQHTSDVVSDMSRFNFIVANAKFSRIVRKILDLVGS